MTCRPASDGLDWGDWPRDPSPARRRSPPRCSPIRASRCDVSWPTTSRSSTWLRSAPSSGDCDRASAERSSSTHSTRRSRGSMPDLHPFALRRILALRQFPVLCDAELGELALFAENVAEVTLPAGIAVATAGSQLTALHLVLDG